MINALRSVLAIELLHAAQGQDFRIQEGKTLGKKTADAHKAVRELVPFLDKDRVLTYDILALEELVKSLGT